MIITAGMIYLESLTLMSLAGLCHQLVSSTRATQFYVLTILLEYSTLTLQQSLSSGLALRTSAMSNNTGKLPASERMVEYVIYVTMLST